MARIQETRSAHIIVFCVPRPLENWEGVYRWRNDLCAFYVTVVKVGLWIFKYTSWSNKQSRVYHLRCWFVGYVLVHNCFVTQCIMQKCSCHKGKQKRIKKFSYIHVIPQISWHSCNVCLRTFHYISLFCSIRQLRTVWSAMAQVVREPHIVNVWTLLLEDRLRWPHR